MIKKVIKSGGHRARFDVTMLTNTAIKDPFTKTAGSPKLDKRGVFFDDACGITQDLTCIVYPLTYQKKCFLLPLFLLYATK